jgi:predicted nucleic acid-binding protein
MAAKVVDASAMAAYLFGEPELSAVGERLSEGSLFAPPLLFIELANVCLNKIRRHPHLRDALQSALGEAGNFGIVLLETDPVAVLDLAERAQLTAYDASYLWLARRLDAELVTLDRSLMAAAADTPRH